MKTIYKQLKDARFPTKHFDCQEPVHTDDTCNMCVPNYTEIILEELIAELPDGLFQLHRTHKERWEASFHGLYLQVGSTPSEAVARLWIELQKHENNV